MRRRVQAVVGLQTLLAFSPTATAVAALRDDRIAALAAIELGRRGALAAIEPLVARLEKGEPPAAFEGASATAAGDALRQITGGDFDRAEEWRRWWRDAGKAQAGPEGAPPAEAEVEAAARALGIGAR